MRPPAVLLLLAALAACSAQTPSELQFEARDGVRHVIARQLHDQTGLLHKLDVRSRDYR